MSRLLVALFVLSPVAWAESADTRADAVIAAFQAKRPLAELAGRNDQDSWLVVDSIASRGHPAIALAFAKATKWPDSKRLIAYAASQPKYDDRSALTGAIVAALDARRTRNLEQSLVHLQGVEADGRVLTTYLAYRRGGACFGLRRYGDAGREAQKIIVAADRLGWLRLAARARSLLGMSRMRAGDPAGALAPLEECVELEVRRGDKQRTGGALMDMATALRYVGRCPEALAALERARRLKVEIGDKRGLAQVLGNTGNIHAIMGDFPRALEFQERALQGKREFGRERDLPQTLNNLGSLYSRVGAMREARAAFDEALVLARKHKRERDIGMILGNLALWHDNRGDSAAALLNLHAALAQKEKVRDGRGATITLTNLGALYAKLGQERQARRCYDEALAISRRMRFRRSELSALHSLGGLAIDQGNADVAEAHFKEALALSRKYRDAFSESRVLIGLGSADSARGRIEPALASFRSATAIKTKLNDRRGAAMVELNVAILEGRRERWKASLRGAEGVARRAEELQAGELAVAALAQVAEARFALAEYDEALAAAREALRASRLMLRGLGEEQAASVRSRTQQVQVYTTGVRAAWAKKDLAEMVYFLESGRAGALLESLGGRERLRAVVIPAKLRSEEARARAAVDVAHWHFDRAVESGRRAEIKRRRAELRGAQDSLAGVIARLQATAKAGADVAYPSAASLAQLQGALGKDEALVLYSVLRDKTLALVIEPGGARAVDLGKSAPILVAAAAAPSSRDAKHELDALRKAIAKPLALKARRVLVSPDGALGYVAFAALFPGRDVVMVPSGTTYRTLKALRRGRGKGVLALGDPEYKKLARLPHTRAEAKAVGTKVLLGAEATRTCLAEALAAGEGEGGWRAVHFACHGLVDPERPALGALVLGDGRLNCLELAQLDLRADLVVLSACETGKGRIYKAEGIVGLARSFMLAGAPRVVCSLWKVDDEATRALMVKFYELWSEMPTATALKNAQAFVASHDKWKHPYYWAAWQLWGLAE